MADPINLTREQIANIVNGDSRSIRAFELLMGGSGAAEWIKINFTSSDIADILTRPHSGLQAVSGADEMDTNATKDKHVSNAQMKTVPDHTGATSAHGAGGNIVGATDYASATGGVVLIAAAVADASASTVSVTSANAADLASVITLANEIKGDLNQLVVDVNLIKDQLNSLLASSRTAKQLTP